MNFFLPPRTHCRWDSQYEEVEYHHQHFRLLVAFFEDRAGKTDSEILPKLNAHVKGKEKV